MNRILLIDADVLAYRAACAVEVATEWEPGYWTWHCEEGEVRSAITSDIERLMDEFEWDSYKLCLTDTVNWRQDVLPTYKRQRANVRKPLVLKPIRQWMIDELDAVIRHKLEGDDVMGILATWKGLAGEKVIVSIDKDMKTIPGLWVRSKEDGIKELTEQEADYWHMFQTLMGDATDGYSGCPGVGPVAAAKALGEIGDHDPARMWEAVLATYAKKKLGVGYALEQARVARILRASDFDFKKKEPILWTPPQ
jgi:DNA polymerase-1